MLPSNLSVFLLGNCCFAVVLFFTGISSLSLTSEEESFIRDEGIGGVLLFSKNYGLKWKNALKIVGIKEENLKSFKFSNYSGSA